MQKVESYRWPEHSTLGYASFLAKPGLHCTYLLVAVG